MGSHARVGDRVRKLLALLALGAAVWLGSPGVAPGQQADEPVQMAQACHGWSYYGCYSCYHSACEAASYLRACGYDTYIRSCHGHYYLYYR